jgi:hypothetical protein
MLGREWICFDGRWALDRLAAALFVGSKNPEGRLMALFTAYLDAAGDSTKQPFIIVSGFIANFVQWKGFDGVWRNVHEQYNVALPFHMAEFYSALTNPNYKNQSNARSDYVEIVKDAIRWRPFVQALVYAQATFINCAVTAVVRMNVYNEMDSLLELREKIPPFALGARYCVNRVRKWEKEFEITEPVEMIFEEGDLGQGEFSRLMVGEGSALPIYKKKSDFLGLQAADQYAWEMARRLKDEEKEKQLCREFEARNELMFLYYSIPKLHIEPTAESLAFIANERGIKVRAWKK